MCVVAASDVVLNFPLVHGSVADALRFRHQLNDFLVRSNSALRDNRDKFLNDIHSGRMVTTAEVFNEFFNQERIRQALVVAIRDKKVVFERSDGAQEGRLNKRSWTLDRIFKFKQSSDECAKRLSEVSYILSYLRFCTRTIITFHY